MLITAAVTPDQAAQLGEYLASGHSYADWLHDTAIQCERCKRHYDDRADFADPDDYGVAANIGWLCNTCADGMTPSASVREADAADRRLDEGRV